MNYVTCDLHGEDEKIEQLLRLIRFSSNDKLFVIGDVIDRGKEPIKLLLKIMRMENVELILGNHEEMMLRAVKYGGRWEDIWLANRSRKTAVDFLNLSKNVQQQVVDYLDSLPLTMDLFCEGENYHLVHGWPSEDDHCKVWGRPTKESVNPLIDTKLLVGHTPVPLILYQDGLQQNLYLQELKRKKEHLRIFHGCGGWYGLDTGNSYRMPGSCLSCLRLEDQEEFYVI